MKGPFTGQKTNKQFSSIALDQIHEQKNIRVNNLAEATLMFVRFNALLRRKFSEPELCKMLEALGEMFNCGQEDLNQ